MSWAAGWRLCRARRGSVVLRCCRGVGWWSGLLVRSAAAVEQGLRGAAGEQCGVGTDCDESADAAPFGPKPGFLDTLLGTGPASRPGRRRPSRPPNRHHRRRRPVPLLPQHLSHPAPHHPIFQRRLTKTRQRHPVPAGRYGQKSALIATFPRACCQIIRHFGASRNLGRVDILPGIPTLQLQ